MVEAWEAGATAAVEWPHPETRVWGLRVPRALADFLVLDALRASDGVALAVPEEEVAPMQAGLARREGLLVGPEGAAAVCAVKRLAESGRLREGERVVVFQTGHPASYR